MVRNNIIKNIITYPPPKYSSSLPPNYISSLPPNYNVPNANI